MFCKSWFEFYGNFFASHGMYAYEYGPLWSNKDQKGEKGRVERDIPQPPLAISSSNLYFPAKAVKSMLK